MLKNTNFQDAMVLHTYLLHPMVYPFVRNKAETLDEYLFLIKRLMEEEEKGHLILRTIMDEHAKPVGQIGLYDLQNRSGFLGTWLGVPFQGKGYNRLAKELFFQEMFEWGEIDTIYMKVRKTNLKSQKALAKFPYVEEVTPNRDIYRWVNQIDEIYDVFQVTKENFEIWLPNSLEA